MDTFYSFLIFALLLVLEQFAVHSWLAVYYRLGIPIFIIRKQHNSNATSQEDITSDEFSPRELAKKLAVAFAARPDHPSIKFKALATKNKTHREIAFHESLFESRPGFRYLPVTHSLARMKLERCEVSVTAYLDWYVLFVLVYLAQAAFQDRSFIIIAVVVLFIFTISLLSQRAVDKTVAEKISSILWE
jgi:hypothetical protein